MTTGVIKLKGALVSCITTSEEKRRNCSQSKLQIMHREGETDREVWGEGGGLKQPCFLQELLLIFFLLNKVNVF